MEGRVREKDYAYFTKKEIRECYYYYYSEIVIGFFCNCIVVRMDE